ncbi:hypothetical protein M9H77_08017 [Catharanthus roseus]|uniref:Uncharacterized protein n=1 Tax=Catharanthus roseus TaxID=4058 RepID=A0ACC0BWU5_CATRO|nr:hypothetical protein M9H77_08017 [Catharanthus roseus]
MDFFSFHECFLYGSCWGFCISGSFGSIWGQRGNFKKLRNYLLGEELMTRLARPYGVRIEEHLAGMNMWTKEWVTHDWLVPWPLPNDTLSSVTLDLDPVDRGRSTVGGLDPRRGYFLASWVRVGPPTRLAQGGVVSTPGLVICLSITINSRIAFLSFLEIRTYLWFRKMSVPHSSGHETEAMPKILSHGQTNATSHEIIGNFMTKMMELLEATLANRRGERAQNTNNDEALERFLRFRPPEFHGEVE